MQPNLFMAIDVMQSIDIIEVMENAVENNRPPEDIRDELDLGYKIEDQSIILFDIRPRFDNPSIIMEYPFAKATFVKAKNEWKIFWLRASGKWDSYGPQPTVKKLKEFTEIVFEDKHFCFKG